MKFSRLLKESRLYWPSQVSIEDGELKDNGGGFFPTLSKTWDRSELLQNEVNEWHSLMSWVIFCGFHRAACESLRSGSTNPVRYSDLNRQYMQGRLQESLQATYPSWPKHMRSQFRADAPL